MMRGVGRVKKTKHQIWLTKRLGLGLLFWGFKGVQEEILFEEPELFKSGQWHFHQDNTPVHNSILITEYLTKIGIKIVPYRPIGTVRNCLDAYDLLPVTFVFLPKLRGCRHETIEEMKKAVTKVIDTLK